MMALYLEDLASSTIKSMLRVSHQASSTGIEWSTPTRGFLEGFIWRQRSQVLIYCPIYLDIWGHQ